MAKSGKPWHICDDCLDPLARKLVSIAQRLGHSFDVAKAIRLDTEYRQIQKDSNYCDTRLTDAQRKRQDELNEQMRAQIKPPRARDIEYLYQDYRIKTAIEWLKVYVSVEYADSFEHTLFDATKRFFDLEFKACQTINHDEGKESTIEVRYPIQRLIDRHYRLLRDLFPEHEHHPDRDELPEYLRVFEVEIMEEYDKTKKQIREVAKYLQRVSVLVRPKMKKADVSEIQEAQTPRAGNEERRDDEAEVTKPTRPASKSTQRAQWLAMAMLLVRDNPDWPDAKIAKEVGKDKSTLSRSREYQVAAAMARGNKEDRHRGHISVDPESGLRDVEAYSDDPVEHDWDD